ncbi:MAG: CPBP family intramembrane metalloprotease [Treponema sp.]|jgi:membrane protease YdiL (CAAX protease family)|nr:CPBP family intramembrane metalloprotease [Treponema sp.]
MRIYIEAIILYSVLFLSGTAGALININAGADQTPERFQVYNELIKVLFYCIPALILIWYLALKDKPVSDWKIKPVKNDLLVFVITLPALLLIGFSISSASNIYGETRAELTLYPPSGFLQWLVLCVSCISAAYLEESFFRFYLLTNRTEMKINDASALVLSTALFAICHIYEGPWGFLNSILSGVFLAFIFLRRNSIHGIAFAHGLYNIAVFTLTAFVKRGLVT